MLRCGLLLLTLTALAVPQVDAHVKAARAYLFRSVESVDGSSLQNIGIVDFRDVGGKVQVNGTIRGLAPGKHGFHVHNLGNLDNKCVTAGPHFNPDGRTHGAPEAHERHVGDLGNIETRPDGSTSVSVHDSLIQLNGPKSIVGRSLVVHEKPDDLGLGSSPESKKTGNAGARFACGIIGITEQ
ncbi:SOD-4 protein [Aphelenchoides avenae]|nr:SOD-4 protein [Aphelenchus avenae]